MSSGERPGERARQTPLRGMTGRMALARAVYSRFSEVQITTGRRSPTTAFCCPG
jgi:hypothetical protein